MICSPVQVFAASPPFPGEGWGPTLLSASRAKPKSHTPNRVCQLGTHTIRNPNPVYTHTILPISQACTAAALRNRTAEYPTRK